MGGCFFGLAVIFFFIGLVQLLAPERGTSSRPLDLPTFNRPRSRQPDVFPQPAAPQPVGQPVQPGGGARMASQFDWIRVGERIRVDHPTRGELTVHVDGKVVYEELWQTSRGPQAPWVPTGNAFAGFWLENSLFLLSWQNRVYLLDERVPLSDADIQRDFAPHARKFAQSDQTADVYFAYPPAMWHIDDIGKFRISQTQGEGLVFRQGAIGRFIHSSGDAQRALVLEDYEGGGGGQDTVWTGYLVEPSAVAQS